MCKEGWLTKSFQSENNDTVTLDEERQSGQDRSELELREKFCRQRATMNGQNQKLFRHLLLKDLEAWEKFTIPLRTRV